MSKMRDFKFNSYRLLNDYGVPFGLSDNGLDKDYIKESKVEYIPYYNQNDDKDLIT